MKPNLPFAHNLRDMAYVPRWAIARRNRQQYLAEHSYFVTVYADQVARLIEWKGDFAELMRYALYHDLDETITGDIPGPAKRAGWDKKATYEFDDTMTYKYGWDVCRTRQNAKEDVKAIVSLADSLDEVCYLCEESRLGNSWISSVLDEAVMRLKDRWYKLPATTHLLDSVWEDYLSNIVYNQHKQPVLLKDKI